MRGITWTSLGMLLALVAGAGCDAIASVGGRSSLFKKTHAQILELLGAPDGRSSLTDAGTEWITWRYQRSNNRVILVHFFDTARTPEPMVLTWAEEDVTPRPGILVYPQIEVETVNLGRVDSDEFYRTLARIELSPFARDCVEGGYLEARKYLAMKARFPDKERYDCDDCLLGDVSGNLSGKQCPVCKGEGYLWK